MHLDTLNTSELFTEIAELARTEGVTGQNSWNELVNQVLEGHEDIGEMNDDQDLEGLRKDLYMKYTEYARESVPESDAAISEDPNNPHA